MPGQDATYEVWVSFLEIYEDVAYDLLDLNGGTKATGRLLRSGTLRVMEKGNTCYAHGKVVMSGDVFDILCPGIPIKSCHMRNVSMLY